MRTEEAYKILKKNIRNFLNRNDLTYIAAESRLRNLLLNLLFPSINLSIANLVQEMHELSLILHDIEQRIEDEKSNTEEN